MSHIVIPETKGVEYKIDDRSVSGVVEVDGTVVVTAVPQTGYRFAEGCTTEWLVDPIQDPDEDDALFE